MSTLATISVGLATYSPKIAIVPPVIIKVIKENKITLPTNPHRFPFLISSSFLTNLAKSPKLITTAAKYPTIIPNTAMNAPNDPKPSKPPVRSPPENIVPTSEKSPPPALAHITNIKTIITA